MFPGLLIVLVVVLAIASSGVRILKEYERAVVFRLGRAQKKLAGPGMVLLFPLGIDRPRVVDLRTKVVQIPPQEVITKDNISIVVDAVVYITVESPSHAILDVRGVHAGHAATRRDHAASGHRSDGPR